MRPAQPEKGIIFPQKIDNRYHTAQNFTDIGSHGGADKPETEYSDQKKIQNNICSPGHHRNRQPGLRFFRHIKIHLKGCLQHKKRHA